LAASVRLNCVLTGRAVEVPGRAGVYDRYNPNLRSIREGANPEAPPDHRYES